VGGGEAYLVNYKHYPGSATYYGPQTGRNYKQSREFMWHSPSSHKLRGWMGGWISSDLRTVANVSY
jgi:hypothetical protein